jgi:hypothetical protein
MKQKKKTGKLGRKKKPLRKKEKRNDKDLQEMTQYEKKAFLQNDLVERMVRIEQAVSGQMGKKITHHETDFFKELSDEEKKEFNKHLNSKKRKNVGKMLLLILPLATFGLMRFNVTGNAIRDSTGAEPYWWGWVALGIFIVFGIFMWTSHLLKMRIEGRLKGHEKDLIKRLKK